MSAANTVEQAPARRGGRGGHAQKRRLGRNHERLLNWLSVGLPTLLLLALCLYDLTSRSLWLDESATVAIVSQHGSAFGSALARDGGNMLAYYALMHVLVGWFGSGEFLMRFPSVGFAAVAVACTGCLALRLFERRVAVFAGLLSAVSLSLVYWGQDARGYTAMIALVTASFLAFVALLDGQGGWGSWLAYVVLTTAAIYTGLEAVLVIPAQVVLVGWRHERLRAVAGAVVAVGVCCIPLAILAASRGSGQLFWVPPPSGRVLRQITQALTSSGLQPDFYTSTTTALLVLTVVLLTFGLIEVARVIRRDVGRAAMAPAVVVSWLLIPAAFAAVESTIGQSIFQARYLLVSLPAVSLLLAWTLGRAGVPRTLWLGAMTALIALRALQLAPAYGVSSENWRGATRYIISNTRPRDCIAFYPLDNRQAFRYYLTSSQQAPRPILPSLSLRKVRPFVEDYSSLSPAAVRGLPEACQRVWLVASHEGRAGGPPLSRANYQHFAALTSGLRRSYPIVRSADFGAQGLVTVSLYSR